MRRTASTEPHGSARATERLGSDPGGIARATELLRGGRLVAFPTETVYGLGADGRSPAAVASLYAAKGRPRFNPLIAHVAEAGAARREGRLDSTAETLAAAFWPGPLTLVVPLADGATTCDLARAGLMSIGLRVPAHPVTRALLERCGFPVVAPSANLSGRVSPTEADHVYGDLDGRIDAVIDGGSCVVGLESTIVACLGVPPTLLRAGGVPTAAIEAVLGVRLAVEGLDIDRPLAPGALLSHYAPRARVRLDAAEIRPREAALLFGPEPVSGTDGAAAALNLSPEGDLAEAAANLFGFLRRLDAFGTALIAVAAIPSHGLGEAINDRLRRAAAGR